ncbi:Gfo/Idh/MocA family protein [Flavimarina sp. Hel_I_48]|uniref:Gfo/Idh/MocA family protein n=1 Tax=Flavimarina sp. Hel_I_48 TaxID=1392488 RepID=UPI000A5C6661|nr:Gfo/Idh/MocA family oxidoreductase [Flavimarina sp. Hel_I_48]
MTTMKTSIITLLFIFVTIAITAQQKLKVVVAGLSHDHAHVIMNEYKEGKVSITGIVESDKDLIARYSKSYKLDRSIFYSDLKTALDKLKPDAVLAYNPVSEHIDVARIALPMQIPVMVEKPLATTLKDAKEMAKLSRDNSTPLLTNYETTWYGSNQTLAVKVKNTNFGTIKKMIAKDGHEGPKEIGCSAEFLDWLTDPVKNGGGAIMDFGCYGANLMTWLKNGQKPIAVTAVTRNLKPDVYPKVDDDATIILEYEDGNGIIEASWDWSYGIKGLQVYGDSSSFNAVDGNTLEYQKQAQNAEKVTLTEDFHKDHLTYLQAVINHNVETKNDLSSLENNLIVVEILEAAKKSAKTGERVKL